MSYSSIMEMMSGIKWEPQNKSATAIEASMWSVTLCTDHGTKSKFKTQLL